MAKSLSDWRVHLMCIAFVVLAELIGNQAVGPFPVMGANLGFTMFPMLFVLVFGIVLGSLKLIPHSMMVQASPYIGISVMWLVAWLAAGIGPQIMNVLNFGPALILQELGNLGTVMLALPVAIFVFRMGREAVGAGFSISREGSLAIVGSVYGMDSAQGKGVMGAYVTGTVLGTLFCGIIGSVIVALDIFSPHALAMAAGVGSASMMVAWLAPITDAFPQYAEDIAALAASSQLLTSATGLYMSLLVALPLSNWLYKVCGGEKLHRLAMERKAARSSNALALQVSTPEMVGVANNLGGNSQDTSPQTGEGSSKENNTTLTQRWATRAKVLAFSGCFALIANWINTMGGFGGLAQFFQQGSLPNPDAVVTPLAGLPGMLLILIPIILGSLADEFLRAKTKLRLPSIMFISLIGIVIGLPGMPFADQYVSLSRTMGLLPLCTPILAYAGISIGKDLGAFKQQGVAIVCIALLAFFGTFVGSAMIAEVIINFTGASF